MKMPENTHPAASVINQFGKHVLPWIGDNQERAAAAQQVLQDLVAEKSPVSTPSVVKYIYPDRNFSQYNQYLYSLEEQLETLKNLNERMPEGLQAPKKWFDVDTSSDHKQRLEDLECWYVHWGEACTTWHFNQRLIEFTQPAVYNPLTYVGSFIALGPSARYYRRGLHRVRINMVDNWVTDNGLDLSNLRLRAAKYPKKLAAIESLSAYALQHPKLLQSQDGIKLPGVNLGGLQEIERIVCSSVRSFFWNPVKYRVDFSYHNLPGRRAATPSLIV